MGGDSSFDLCDTGALPFSDIKEWVDKGLVLRNIQAFVSLSEFQDKTKLKLMTQNENIKWHVTFFFLVEPTVPYFGN